MVQCQQHDFLEVVAGPSLSVPILLLIAILSSGSVSAVGWERMEMRGGEGGYGTSLNMDIPMLLKSSWTLLPSFALVSMNKALEAFAKDSPVACLT